MRELDGVLLLEFQRAEQRQRGAVAHAGDVVDLAAQQAAETSDGARAVVLHAQVQRSALANDRDVADQVARSTAGGGPQRQAHVEPRQIVGQQQVAFGLARVEDRLASEPLEITGNQRFGRAGIAAHPQRRQPPEHHAELRRPARHALFRDLDRRQIALVAQDRVGLRANVA
ncbi:hypothetical protein J4558_25125 [Leptolyngbya sp. 15MV]|nr:hypothetical protein J4558_25125 [Leptolyngbya sp. 15MV]